MDIAPTMTDRDVADFIARGYVVLEGVVSDAMNRRCDALPGGAVNEFVKSPAFRDEVALNPAVAGIARSLLGKNFAVPTSGHHHLFEEPHVGQCWHSDGLSDPHYEVHGLQCFYYPADVGREDGPTIVLPGSHFRFVDREAISHYDNIVGQVALVVPAGTVVLTAYGIWHKAGAKLSSKRRGMLKFSYYRTSSPIRDWLVEEDEIPPYPGGFRPAYVTEVESYRDTQLRRQVWNWLCGRVVEPERARGQKEYNTATPLDELVAPPSNEPDVVTL
jgi:hypothetical protein